MQYRPRYKRKYIIFSKMHLFAFFLVSVFGGFFLTVVFLPAKKKSLEKFLKIFFMASKIQENKMHLKNALGCV